MNYRHGHAVGGISPTYRTWRCMQDRCNNPKSIGYADYGGKGVTICERWLSFPLFLADMGDRPSGMTLDRFPVSDGNYEPGNCRWATLKEQMNNRRSNRILTTRGISRTMTMWSETVGLAVGVVYCRLRLGWSVDRALFTPLDQARSQGRRRAIAERERIKALRQAGRKE